jgi:DNA-binding transcriptional LysR family regulator
MDRIDTMKVFVTALDEGSLAGAARRLRRSPTAVSRAVAFLETHVGVELLHRTTRSIKLSEAGERYAAACRRVLVELEEAEMLAAGERSAPRGTLTISAGHEISGLQAFDRGRWPQNEREPRGCILDRVEGNRARAAPTSS